MPGSNWYLVTDINKLDYRSWSRGVAGVGLKKKIKKLSVLCSSEAIECCYTEL